MRTGPIEKGTLEQRPRESKRAILSGEEPSRLKEDQGQDLEEGVCS